MAKSDESGEGSFATLRIPLAGELGSLEGRLLNEIFKDANSRRKGTQLASFLVLQGWLGLIHNMDAHNRSVLLKALDLPADVIDEIAERWPNPSSSGGAASTTPASSKSERGGQRIAGSGAAMRTSSSAEASPAPAAQPQPVEPVVSAPTHSPLGSGGMMV